MLADKGKNDNKQKKIQSSPKVYIITWNSERKMDKIEVRKERLLSEKKK